MSFKRRNIPMTDDLKKEISGAKNIFEVFYSMSRETPPGAYPLNTGEWIRGCQTLYPEFYQKAVEYGSKNYIRTGTNAQYEAELASTGQSGIFVIDRADIRLPKVTRYIRGYESNQAINVHNKVYTSGLPNIEGRVGGLMFWDDRFQNSERVTRQGQQYGTTEYANGAFKKTLVYRGGADGGSGSGFCNGYMDASWSNVAYGKYASDTFGFNNEVVAPCVAMSLYIQVFNQAPLTGYVNVQDVLKLITDYTNKMDQKIQDALNTINSIIEGGALGMPEYERGINLGNNVYAGTYTYTAPSDGWFYVRWVNGNADPTRITTVRIYKDASKARLLETHTTSDGRRAGKDGGTTDQTIFIPVRRGYFLEAVNTNYRRFYPVFGQ